MKVTCVGFPYELAQFIEDNFPLLQTYIDKDEKSINIKYSEFYLEFIQKAIEFKLEKNILQLI